MGLLDIFSKAEPAGGITRLPSGSFTVDAEGRILTSTLPRSFPAANIQSIAEQVLTVFRATQKLQIPLTELVINYAALKITARELRGGAIIFLAPTALKRP